MAKRANETSKPIVAHIASRYYARSENWIHTQIKSLVRYRPLVLTWHTMNLEDHGAPDYYALLERSPIESWANRILYRFTGYYPSFYILVRKHRARLIHSHFGQRGWFAVPLAEAAGVPLITTFYGKDASRLPTQQPEWQHRYERLFKHGDLFLVEGPHMGRQLKALGCPEHKITVHSLGIELDEFPFQARYWTGSETLRILVAARFTEKKGIVYAVEAFAKLLNQGIDAHLTIIGDAGPNEKNQNTKQQILRSIGRLGLANSVTLLGVQPHDRLKKAYYEHHIFLQPSVQARDGNNEGGAPVTLIEAAATGMPVVATHHCDIPEIVQDGITGLLAPERDSASLANHLQSFSIHPRQMQDMGSAARLRVETEYDARIQGKRLESIYDSAIAAKAQGSNRRFWQSDVLQET